MILNNLTHLLIEKVFSLAAHLMEFKSNVPFLTHCPQFNLHFIISRDAPQRDHFPYLQNLPSLSQPHNALTQKRLNSLYLLNFFRIIRKLLWVNNSKLYKKILLRYCHINKKYLKIFMYKENHVEFYKFTLPMDDI